MQFTVYDLFICRRIGAQRNGHSLQQSKQVESDHLLCAKESSECRHMHNLTHHLTIHKANRIDSRKLRIFENLRELKQVEDLAANQDLPFSAVKHELHDTKSFK